MYVASTRHRGSATKKHVSCDENERKSTFFLDEQLNFWIIFFLFCFSLCAAHAFLSSQNTSFLTSFWFFSLHCFFDRFCFLLCVVDVCACMSAHGKTSFKTCHVSFFAIHFLSVSKWKYRFALFSRRILFFLLFSLASSILHVYVIEKHIHNCWNTNAQQFLLLGCCCYFHHLFGLRLVFNLIAFTLYSCVWIKSEGRAKDILKMDRGETRDRQIQNKSFLLVRSILFFSSIGIL